VVAARSAAATKNENKDRKVKDRKMSLPRRQQGSERAVDHSIVLNAEILERPACGLRNSSRGDKNLTDCSAETAEKNKISAPSAFSAFLLLPL
jgi:hypothetical protein